MLGGAHGWHWVIDERVNSDWYPPLEGHSLLLGTILELSNSNTMILHPHLSTWPQSWATNIFWPLLPSPRPLDYSPTDFNTNLTDLM